jgi:hypothetical protein
MVLFAFVLALIGAAVAIPVAAQKAERIGEADAPVLGASVLATALGGINLVALIVAWVIGDIVVGFVFLGLAPVAAGALGLWVVAQRITGRLRALALLLAAVLVLAGIPGYFAPLLAAVVSLIIAVLLLAGLKERPQTTLRGLLRGLDPRL